MIAGGLEEGIANRRDHKSLDGGLTDQATDRQDNGFTA
jgi:hypothetical protein